MTQLKRKCFHRLNDDQQDQVSRRQARTANRNLLSADQRRAMRQARRARNEEARNDEARRTRNEEARRPRETTFPTSLPVGGVALLFQQSSWRERVRNFREIYPPEDDDDAGGGDDVKDGDIEDVDDVEDLEDGDDAGGGDDVEDGDIEDVEDVEDVEDLEDGDDAGGGDDVEDGDIEDGDKRETSSGLRLRSRQMLKSSSRIGSEFLRWDDDALAEVLTLSSSDLEDLRSEDNAVSTYYDAEQTSGLDSKGLRMGSAQVLLTTTASKPTRDTTHLRYCCVCLPTHRSLTQICHCRVPVRRLPPCRPLTHFRHC